MQDAVVPNAYDQIADDYDGLWSTLAPVREAQQRLTEELSLRPGERCADIGCGTGIETLEMLRRVAPGQVLGVDPSRAMLAAAATRARVAGFVLQEVCEGGNEFVAACPEASLDVLSLRLCLGYLDRRVTVPRLCALLRPGGRLGILSILGHSAPQAHATYRAMAESLGLPPMPLTALASVSALEVALREGGGVVSPPWTQRFRLYFDSGVALVAFLRRSGLVAGATLQGLPPALLATLWDTFGRRIEELREAEGIPLDFELVGMVCRRADDPEAMARIEAGGTLA